MYKRDVFSQDITILVAKSLVYSLVDTLAKYY